MEPVDLSVPASVLAAWSLESADLEPIEVGHINRTYRVVSSRARYILQWVNPIFGPRIHEDIEAITAHLADQGLTTPRLVPDDDGRLSVAASDGVWRLMTYIDGETILAADSAERCREAGRLLGRFHRALWDLKYEYRHSRFAVHDTPRHLEALERALEDHADHRNFAMIEPVAEQILSSSEILELGLELPRRHVHGDPKISNLLFEPSGRAVCLVDLDTLARMPLAVELGDAFRSWCCPAGEEAEPEFRADFFEAGFSGYLLGVGSTPSPEELTVVPALTETISLELAARFCADALNESYFGWDRLRFESASQHNLTRARSQLGLAQNIRDLLPELNAIVMNALVMNPIVMNPIVRAGLRR